MLELTPAQLTMSDSSRPESTRSVALLGTAGPLLRLINAACLFPQGPSRQLPSHRAAACVTAAVTSPTNGADRRDALDRERRDTE